MHSIKINRALRQAEIGHFPGSAEHMLSYVPDVLRSALTSDELAIALDMLWTACLASKALAERDAIAEGAIWDAEAQRLREIAA
ncbi:hypothetical protein [Phenylobacterium sp.]|uniref:hypothetical protein n=1 Tax=Phenylobacterium sp. TaxID=1871053 RepID=UPI0025F5727C|nr:hypothetical protein [Phenylobacterium sp.]MBX3482563.1 hypothetical protein [Phenylobacterium sp.]MCW5758771.1 hypothetical protein [Phenylobacterium sp.]